MPSDQDKQTFQVSFNQNLNRTQPTGNLSFNIECSSLHQQLIITFMIQFSSYPEKNPTPNKKHCVRDYKQVVNQCK